MTKIIIAILFFILFLALYIYLNHYVSDKKEGFEPNMFLDNTIKDSFNKSIEDINKITPYNELDVTDISNIQQLVKDELHLGDVDYEIYDELHNIREDKQNTKITSMETQFDNLSKTSLFMGLETDKLTNFRSIKSIQNSQPLNLTPLSNNKYLINVNGQCVENNSINQTSIKPCDLQNPNQYFDMNFVNNNNDYQKYTLGDIHGINLSENYKYPFVMVKSDSGNCLSNKDSYLSVQPCDKTVVQRWNISPEPVICGIKND
jgi:hypothetical protein